MRRQGTAHLIEVMDAYDLLPVHNFQYGKHADTPKIDSQVWDKRFTQGIPDNCWYGCGMACSKGADGHHVHDRPLQGRHRHGGRSRIRERRGPRIQLRPLRSGLAARSELLLRHVRDRHHLVRHGVRLRDGVLGEGHPERRAHGRPRSHLGQRRVRGRTAAPDVARRRVRRPRGQGRAAHAAPVHRERVGRSVAHPRHRHADQGARGLAVHAERVAGAAGRVRPGEQRPAARRSLADLHGHGEQPDPDVRGQGRGPALLPAVPHLVRPPGIVQAAVERHRTAGQREAVSRARSRQGPVPCRQLPEALHRHHGQAARSRRA